MSKLQIVSNEEYLSHEVNELICLKCLHRWIGVYPKQTLLKNFECQCGEVGFVIKTGQTLPEDRQGGAEMRGEEV